MLGFCFSTPGEELGIQYPESNTDFFIFLSDFAKANKVDHIAMTVQDMRFGILGVKDLLRYGFKVIVVDPRYSPIDDDHVIPVSVHRDPDTLDKYYPDCIVIGELITRYHSQRKLEMIKSYFQEGKTAYSMLVLKSGWTVKSTSGRADTNRINTRVYAYVVERDYELETKNAKRRK